MDRKRQFREKVKSQLDSLSFPMYQDLSFQVACQLYKDKAWKDAKTIGITVSRQPEVDTFQIIRKAWEEGKAVAIPKCIPENKELVFRSFNRFSQLEMVYYGLYEPIPAETAEVPAGKIDLLIVPGLAFTPAGYRLGFGGGYYDRLLADYTGDTVSLAFQLQVFPELPIEAHDIPISRVITEEGQVSGENGA
ncbi:5-formyltetrahydrofolate cyclo-ligase [Bacillus sp. FJAT-27251]|uniref:5-formyltetrahydrofolate cyclo-ligase n=1 Tax=Bacillus sp. FJAT-27251 TaxID=1684142 RepID=UPI0006A7E2DC|nr:5-formyltetrahydrofolate cyclo-ligase [Bacillus sp. FJAT-27251]